jgi:1,4-dihydroxy-2-naphthoyl-CoA synthase
MIDYEVIDHIAYIRLNRPEKLNALTNAGLTAYVAALDRFDREDDAHVGIVTGAGRAFSTGADINQRLLAVADEGVDSRSLPSETDAVLACENYKPLIAAVHGYAIGHALGTALLCDLVVAAVEASSPSGFTTHRSWRGTSSGTSPTDSKTQSAPEQARDPASVLLTAWPVTRSGRRPPHHSP